MNKKIRVLIVDDSPAIHGDFAKILCPAIAVDNGLGATENLLFGTPSTAQTPSFELDSAFQGREALERILNNVTRRGFNLARLA